MSARVLKDLDHQVRGAVHDLWLIDKIRRRIDETAELNDPPHPVEVAAAGFAELRDQVDAAGARRFDAPIERNIVAELAGDEAVRRDRHLARYEDEIAGDNVRNIVRHRRRRRRQGEAEGGETRVNAGH